MMLGAELWAGFVVGLAGSVHCVGMCGPLALALPTAPAPGRLLAGRLLYNLGRAVTYAVLGAIFGLLGQLAGLARWQQGASIAIGVALLVAVPLRGRLGAAPAPLLRIAARVRRGLGHLLARPGASSLFAVGLLNGLLPCGLVWIALAGAAATGSTLQGAGVMFAFGLGTLPLMLATSLLGGTLQHRYRLALARTLPVVLVLLGCWFILRGLGLGIPFLSPSSGLAHHHG